MSQKHYDISYLEDTAKLLGNLKKHSYEPFQQITSGTIADLGCGTGIDAINMAKMLDKQIKVIGVDHDQQMIEKAKSSSSDIENVDFVLSEVYPLSYEDEALSGIRAERLLQHLKNTETVIDEIKRVLAVDAPFVIVETDWQSLSFYNGDPTTEKKITQYLTEEKINNGLAAKKLTSYLEHAGFRDIRLEIFPFVLRTYKEACDYIWIDRMVNEMAEKNYISGSEHQVFMEALKNADAQQHFGCAINIVVASCIK
jgi:ubiquinone/menaquinone biosynthesis C-methylase UbiE